MSWKKKITTHMQTNVTFCKRKKKYFEVLAKKGENLLFSLTWNLRTYIFRNLRMMMIERETDRHIHILPHFFETISLFMFFSLGTKFY